MFTLPGLVMLLVAHYTKVHEIVAWMRPLPVLHLLYGVACFGLLLDLRLKLTQAEPSPHLRLVLPLWLWTFVSLGLTGGLRPRELIGTMIYLLPFILVVQGVRSFRSLRVVGYTLLGTSVFLGIVGFVQARSPFECVRLGAEGGHPDGRPCERAEQCREAAEPWEDFVCERPGPLETTSVAHGRVRYRGILEDPNELALILVMALPFVMTAVEQRPSLLNVLLALGVLAITLPVVIWTSSRTGQMAFVTVVALYVMKGRGWKGLMITAVLALPVLLLGGRSGGEADASAEERLEAWAVGLGLLKQSPIWGIGKGQFLDHHILTAHNTFVLESAELGFIGAVMWAGVLYLNFKIVLLALRRYGGKPGTETPAVWARALLASLCGLTVGANFLSLGYHPVVWTYLALPGAYYFAVRRHDPDFRVGFGLRDACATVGIMSLYLATLKVYLMARGQ